MNPEFQNFASSHESRHVVTEAQLAPEMSQFNSEQCAEHTQILKNIMEQLAS